MKNLKLILIALILTFSFIEFSVKAAQYFTITVIDETFCTYITDPATVQLAYENYQGENTKHIIGNISAGGGGFNQPWHWHLLPDTVRLVDASVEICDGKPSDVEKGFIIGIYCPWASTVTRIGCPTVTSTTTSIRPEPSSTSTIRTRRGGGGRNYLLDLTSMNIMIILTTLIMVLAIVYGVFYLFKKKK